MDRRILSQTIEFQMGGLYQIPPGYVMNVTPEMAARVVWLRRARREWSKGFV
jgi:hypothetical protein